MKKINFKKVFSGRNAVFSLLILAVVFLIGHTAGATAFGDWAGNVVGGIIGVFIRAVAGILILLVGVLMDVASYSDFIHAGAITKGWIVVRDICNMFFVVILLVIAFATILGQEEYGAKKMLPKLIMAAVLINFSKMFCGLMIDVASVVMLTFVNAFSAIGAGNILDLLGITTITQVDPNATVSFTTIVSAYIFGLIYVLIATVVVASMLGMLVMRVVMIWILVVLSPLAFFLQAVPGKGQQYASQWWSRWSSNLLVGPVIAFFLWLSFAALQVDTNPIQNSGTADAENTSINSTGLNNTASSTGGLGSEAGTTAQMAKFVIAIGMLLGGMKIAQEVGQEAGAALGTGMAAISKGKSMAISGATSAAKGTGKLAGRGALGLVSQADRGIGKLAGVQGDERKSWAGKLAKGWGDDLQATSKKNRKAAAAKYLGHLGMGEKTAIAGQEVIGGQNFQTTANVIKGGLIGGGAALALGATAPVSVIAASVVGAAGWIGSRAKNKRKKTISDYETAQTQSNSAEMGNNSAQKDLNEHNSSQAVVDDFKKNEDIVTNYKGSTMGANAKGKDFDEYTASKAFVNNKNNIKNNENGTKYLKETKTSLQEKQDAAQNAATNLQDKQQILSRQDKTKYDAAIAKTKKRTFTDNLLDRLSAPKAAMADMTKKQEAAKGWVNGAAANSNVLATSGAAGSIYSSSGLSENWKHRFDQLNKGGGNNDLAIGNLMAEIGNSNTKPAKLVELAKAIAAYEAGGATINPSTFGQVKSALIDKNEDPSKYTGTVSRNYKDFDEESMSINKGAGGLQYDTFAKNSAKDSASRNDSKDIMGASFDKINERAKKLGVDYKLDDAAGANQETDGAKIKELGTVMSSLIDDEIASLEATGDSSKAQNISQLKTAKARLQDGDMSGLSLKNTDVSYNSRADEYNSTQHEIMHQAGAKNEEAVYAGADALQNAKLIGKSPENGERYDKMLGQMIASMEGSGSTSEAISQAITDQVGKWQVPKAQIVYETESGKRDDVSSAVLRATEPTPEDSSQVVEAIDKLSDSLNKPTTSVGGGGAAVPLNKQTIEEREFFRHMFENLKKTISKDDKKIATPLEAMASIEKNKKTI